MAKRLLIVDDEPSIVKGLKYSLEQDGYETLVATDGQEALDVFAANKVDLILLDVMLPKIGGLEVCQRIREVSNVPIIMVTAKGEDLDKILGLEYGADDYMTKPFNRLEVKARIKTILRRVENSTTDSAPREITARNMVVNLVKRTVTVDNRDIYLTAKEFDLLQLFITNRGKAFSRSELLDTIWKDDFDGEDRTVDVHISRLREKIEANPKKPEFIITIWGVGYYFADK